MVHQLEEETEYTVITDNPLTDSLTQSLEPQDKAEPAPTIAIDEVYDAIGGFGKL